MTGGDSKAGVSPCRYRSKSGAFKRAAEQENPRDQQHPEQEQIAEHDKRVVDRPDGRLS